MAEQEKTTQYSDFKTVTKFNVRWMRHRMILWAVSFILIAFSIVSFMTKGLNLGIDFKGGVLIEVGFEKIIPIDELRQTLTNKRMPFSNVQTFGEREIIINIGVEQGNSIIKEIKSVLLAEYKDNITFRRVETVGPKVGQELISTSLTAVSIAIAAMLLYIWIRFELPFALGSIVALGHDVLLTIGIFSFFQIEFGLPIIAALLTIIGYSMNDTVVTYDRIRENLVLYRKANLKDIIDLSINETMNRTLVTSGTTLLSLMALLIFGGEVIKPFILAMSIGVIVGTYSSIFVATPFLLFFKIENNFTLWKKEKKKPSNILLMS